MDTNSTNWKISADTASFSCNGLTGAVPLSDPSLGMSLIYNEASIDGSLWSFADLLGETVKPTETYIRGEDLVLSMPATKSFPCETVWYWSVSPLAAGAMIRLTLSLQTDLLDTSPEVKLSSTLAGEDNAAEAEPGQARCLASMPAAWNCFEVAHPSDLSECLAERVGQTESLSITLPFLEKGVIRRARIAAIFLPSDAKSNDLQKAVSEFVEEPLPLTT